MYRFCLVCVSVRPSVRLSVRARVSGAFFLPPTYITRRRAVRSNLELILVYCLNLYFIVLIDAHSTYQSYCQTGGIIKFSFKLILKVGIN